ncbi:chemotaxis protein CheB [Spirosoma fluviale]|uniref:Two-component system, chemotaxis family, CheB/CheR fusion protein n=1 Tax=Spirosoma fluviale TaxID=1597977 RepID=A0A286GD26_9BACT|nr:chemotaxis protein CheB [Spirosoma fluviale]SOD92904.1 two-component system, chemotaxis family, CheB/CheR fusion protein [Spirosoma fluviale]
MKSAKTILSTNIFPVVGIGASAGGLDAFKKLIKAIPEESGMAYVLVQHLAPTHESLLPEILQKVTAIPVLEIADEIKVRPNHIYILPSNKMLVANDGILQLSPRPTTTEPNLPIDLFFQSLAAVHRNEAIGVILSGMGSDGTLGLKAIKENGGITMAQDRDSAAYDGMPLSAISADVVDFVLPPHEIPRKILELTQSLRQGHPTTPEMDDADIIRQILSVLRTRHGIDFTYYKQTTIRRRISRRITLSRLNTPADYLAYLQKTKPEQDALYQDLLIAVTTFFRDPKSFALLSRTIFPLLLKTKADSEPIRLWVAGCSTGQEAYSIAICMKELLGNSLQPVHIFATDLSKPAIAKARTGIYTKKEVETISAQRLQQYFVKIKGGYQVSKEVRDMCVFANQNFLNDPPFGKMDFISCRNVLIYMDAYLQKKALTTFHYALNSAGFLMLGKSETVSSVSDLFAVMEKVDKVFTRKDVPGRFIANANQRAESSLSSPNAKPVSKPSDYQKTADYILFNQYTPAGVIVNDVFDIVHFHGLTAPFLEQSPGKPSHNVLLMAKHGLAFELRSLLHKVKKEDKPVRKELIPFQTGNRLQTLSIDVIPLPNTLDACYLILFYTTGIPDTTPTVPSQKGGLTKPIVEPKDQLIHQLEQELAQARDDMRSITQDQEAINEQLQSANEELLSGNEELQSLNEELETSKEEQQSSNEELMVVNEEITRLNGQLTIARDYAEAIIANIGEPLLVLDQRLRVKTANNAFYKTFQVNETETEGVLIYDIGNREWNIPELRTLLERILPEKSTFRAFELTHTFAAIGRRVMLLNAREIIHKNSKEKLILLSIEDITQATNERDQERLAQQQLQFMADAMPEKVWTADAAGNANYFNHTWLRYSGLTFDDLKAFGWENVVHPDDQKENKKRWHQSIRTGAAFNMQHRLRDAAGAYKWHLSRSVAQLDDQGRTTMWIGTSTENHEQQLYQEELEKSVASRTVELNEANQTLAQKNEELQQMNKELESFTYVSGHDLQEPLRKIQTFAGRIMDEESQQLTDNGKRDLQRLQLAAARMQELIQDLLAFSRLNVTERTFEPTDLQKLTDEVISQFQETISEKQAIIDIGELGMVTIIVFQFRQLLQNLIGNALKFSVPGIPPCISIVGQRAYGRDLTDNRLLADTSYFHLSLTDNGIGFDPQYKERIFEVFQRLHGREAYAGTGIGLAIVKKIVENHNGLITATSELNKGARFDIYIPEPDRPVAPVSVDK